VLHRSQHDRALAGSTDRIGDTAGDRFREPIFFSRRWQDKKSHTVSNDIVAPSSELASAAEADGLQRLTMLVVQSTGIGLVMNS
jgi:hypothetical protein